MGDVVSGFILAALLASFISVCVLFLRMIDYILKIPSKRLARKRRQQTMWKSMTKKAFMDNDNRYHM